MPQRPVDHLPDRRHRQGGRRPRLLMPAQGCRHCPRQRACQLHCRPSRHGSVVARNFARDDSMRSRFRRATRVYCSPLRRLPSERTWGATASGMVRAPRARRTFRLRRFVWNNYEVTGNEPAMPAGTTAAASRYETTAISTGEMTGEWPRRARKSCEERHDDNIVHPDEKSRLGT